MARGAVVVILSDGWERGDPLLVGREMERLSRLAHRIVWVNPRVAATGFTVGAGGMVAALPYCDALVSGHSFAALGEVVAAIGGERDGSAPEPAGRGPGRTSPSRGQARRPCRAARWRCPAGTVPARERRRQDGPTSEPRRSASTPGASGPPRGASPGRAAARVLRSRAAQRADSPPGAPAACGRRDPRP